MYLCWCRVIDLKGVSSHIPTKRCNNAFVGAKNNGVLALPHALVDMLEDLSASFVLLISPTVMAASVLLHQSSFMLAQLVRLHHVDSEPPTFCQ